MTRFLTWLQNFLRDIPGEDGAEWQIAEPEPDIQFKTYMFGGGMEEGEWITHWEERA